MESCSLISSLFYKVLAILKILRLVRSLQLTASIVFCETTTKRRTPNRIKWSFPSLLPSENEISHGKFTKLILLSFSASFSYVQSFAVDLFKGKAFSELCSQYAHVYNSTGLKNTDQTV